MLIFEFQPDFERLARFFRKGRLAKDPDFLDGYYRHAKDIPVEAWPGVVDDLMGEGGSMPSPKSVWKAWLGWRRSNPDKCVRRRQTFKCEFCDDSGHLYYGYVAEIGAMEYEYTCACGHCQNIHEQFPRGTVLEVLTVEQIKQKGGRWLPPASYTRKQERRAA